jgi:hypothetical protein
MGDLSSLTVPDSTCASIYLVALVCKSIATSAEPTIMSYYIRASVLWALRRGLANSLFRYPNPPIFTLDIKYHLSLDDSEHTKHHQNIWQPM